MQERPRKLHALTQLCARRAWNAETAITGGLVADDLLSIVWNKIAALTGGSQEWPIGLGLRPWYLKVRAFAAVISIVASH